jgi:hypothetical protein
VTQYPRSFILKQRGIPHFNKKQKQTNKQKRNGYAANWLQIDERYLRTGMIYGHTFPVKMKTH